MKQTISLILLIALALLVGTPGDLFAQGSGTGGGSGPVLNELDRPFEEPQPEPEEEPEEDEEENNSLIREKDELVEEVLHYLLQTLGA